MLPLTPTLFADYDIPSGEVKLAWEMDDKDAGGAEYYYCVYRRRKGQETFRFITTCHKASILIRATCCNLASGPNTT